MKRLIKVQYRRRRENKTDYSSRMQILKAGLPRLVVRRTNRYITLQVIESKEAQDRIICSANSKELLKYGWKNSFSIKNLNASYLTGYLCALKSIKAEANTAIADIGRHMSTKGNRIYAAIKGAIDAGLKINCSEEILPEIERINPDKHVLENIKKQGGK